MPELNYTATFKPADARALILEDLSCPACGHRDPASTYRLRPGNRLRFFCDGCGAFVTISLNDMQADVVHNWSSAGVPRAH